MASVHPHACGEDACLAPAPQHRLSSPPRVWGDCYCVACKSPPDGSPPRVWGRPAAFAPSDSLTPVHPHACAGRHLERGGERGLHWFTPTRVEDAVGRCAVGSLAVHFTRVGEDTTSPNSPQPKHSSPPRVWGRHSGHRHGAARPRFTPTRVGKTRQPGALVGRARSSPPRVWGRLNLTRPGLRHPWFTPTRVGKTGWPGVALARWFTHACGEDALGICGYEPWAGSPPRVWGRRLRWGRCVSARFTPRACGEKTFWAYARAGLALVHPACGEDSLAARL